MGGLENAGKGGVDAPFAAENKTGGGFGDGRFQLSHSFLLPGNLLFQRGRLFAGCPHLALDDLAALPENLLGGQQADFRREQRRLQPVLPLGLPFGQEAAALLPDGGCVPFADAGLAVFAEVLAGFGGDFVGRFAPQPGGGRPQVYLHFAAAFRLLA